MLQKLTKNLSLNIPAILLCLSAVLIFSFFTKADSGAKIQFTADTIISLTGITDGDLYIASNSECDSLSVSGSTLTIGDIPAGSDLILKTSSHNNALKITPSGGALDLTFESGNLSSGNITQWTLEGSNPVQAIHIVGTPEANKWYAVKINGVLLNNYQSNTSSEISFTYDGNWSSKVFTIEGGSAPGGGLPPGAYNPPTQPESTTENPDNNFSVTILRSFDKLKINSAQDDNNTTVTLKLNAGSDTVRMAISNTEDFENASQVLYEEEVSWDLLDCNTPSKNPPSPLLQSGNSQEGNIYTVYAKFYTKYGVASEVVSDSIVYTDKDSESSKDSESGEEFIPEGSLVQVENDYKVYIKKGNYLRHIPNPTIFGFYTHFKWDDIRTITKEQFNNYQVSTLVRELNDKKVYQINALNLTKRHLNLTAEQFENSGRSWEMIYIINKREKDFYETGENVK